jgi:hypothetical protein
MEMKYYIKNKISINKIAELLNPIGLRWYIDTENWIGVDKDIIPAKRNFIYVDIDECDEAYEIEEKLINFFEQMEE